MKKSTEFDSNKFIMAADLEPNNIYFSSARKTIQYYFLISVEKDKDNFYLVKFLDKNGVINCEYSGDVYIYLTKLTN